MSPVPAALRGRLARLRVRSRRAAGVVGVGERTGRAVGAGIEFAEYRPYQPGDDARAIDPGVLARLGQTVVRTRHADQGLAVTVVVDQTASLAAHGPERAARARDLAAAIVYASLSARDRVAVAAADGDGVAWAPSASDVRRAEATFRWLEARRPHGTRPLLRLVDDLAPRLPAQGCLVLVTDGWFDDAVAGIRRLGALGQELVVLLLADAVELDPRRLGGGAVELVDAETGRVVETTLDAAALARRRRAVAAWHETWVRETARLGGRVLVSPVVRPLDRVVLHDLVAAGVLA